MVELELPARHDWAVQEKNYGKLVMEPFEPGFALTVAIAYRRALLSAIHGSAPTWVKIENVLHEFSHLPGVTEDTLDIMLNLRKVVFALHVNRPKILRLRAQGTGVVKASDFEKDADIEVLTPDVPLATLDKDGVLEMEVCVERGRGYVSAEKREPEAMPINAILLDADFSPVERVNFHVEPVATGRERLILEVWTDGTTTPDDAVAQGSQILVQQFSLFAGLTRSQTALAQPERTNGSALPSAIADMPIEDLDLPQRAFNSLKRHGITKVGQLLQTPDDELLRMRNFGKKSLDEIKERLAARGLIEPPIRDETATEELPAEEETSLSEGEEG